jgi:type I restriction enzyme S subunit
MKKGWATKTLGKLCDILDSQRMPITKRDRTAGEYPYYGATGIVDYVNGFIFDERLVLVGEDGAKWESGENTAFTIEGKCWVNNHAHVLRPHRQALVDSWLVHYLNHSDLTDFVSGLTVPKLNQGSLREILIPVPPLSEQQRIVGLLDEAFASLATAQAHAAQNLQNARDLFESHLNAVFTQRGEGWQLRRIPDVCVTFGRGKSRHRPRNEPCLYGGKYPFIQTGDISNADHVITTHTQTYNETGLAQSKLWPKGTVGIAIVGATIGETGVLDFEACFPDSVIGMTVNPAEADPFFLEYMLQHFKEMVKSHGEGSARENINLATFDRLLFPMPSVKEQRQIAAATDALKDQTKRLESIYQRKLAALDELKKSLLHQAFNGEL